MTAPNNDDDKGDAPVKSKSKPAAKPAATSQAPTSQAPTSQAPENDKPSHQVAFAESDYHETKMTYDHGKLPLYVAAVWAVTLVGLIAYFVSYGLPDLQGWGAP